MFGNNSVRFGKVRGGARVGRLLLSFTLTAMLLLSVMAPMAAYGTEDPGAEDATMSSAEEAAANADGGESEVPAGDGGATAGESQTGSDAGTTPPDENATNASNGDANENTTSGEDEISLTDEEIDAEALELLEESEEELLLLEDPVLATAVGFLQAISYPTGVTAANAVGETITVTLSIGASGGEAYGFTFGYQFKQGVLEWDSSTFIADNQTNFPGIALPTSTKTATLMSEAYGGTIRVSYASADPVLPEPAGTTIQYKQVVLKFKVVGTAPSSNISNMPYYGSADALAVFIDKNFDIATLQDDGVFTNAKLVSANTATAVHEQNGDGLHKSIVLCTYTSPLSVSFASGTTTRTQIRKTGTATDFGTATGTAATDIVKVGEYVDVKYLVTAPTGKRTYGLVGGVGFNQQYAQFDKAATIAANPGFDFDDAIYLSASLSYVKIVIESDGSTEILDLDNPFELILKFKITNAVTGTLAFSVGASGQQYRTIFLTDPSLRSADVIGSDGNPIALTLMNPDICAKTAWNNPSGSSSVTVTPLITASITRNAADLAAKPTVQVGDTALIDITINSETDAYGLAVGLTVSTGWFTFDESFLAADNPALAQAISSGKIHIISDGYYPHLYWESDGSTKILTAGVPLTIKIRAKALRTNGTAALWVSGSTVIPTTVVVDPLVRLTGTGGLLEGAATSTAPQAAILAAETAGKVQVAYASAGYNEGASFLIGYNATITFSDVTGETGTSNPAPIVMPITISNDSSSPVYGFEVGIVWSYLRRSVANGGPASNSTEYYLSQEVHVQLDPEATLAANPDLGLEIADYYEAARTFQALRQIWVESDGETVVIAPNSTLSMDLVFVATGGWPETLLQTGGYNLDNNGLCLFTDPTLRVKESGEGLTKIDFLQTAINDNESAGKLLKGGTKGPVAGTGLTAASPTPPAESALLYGRITLVPKHNELILDGNNYYRITNAEEFDAFAAIVNGGDNKINGAIFAQQGAAIPTIPANPNFVGLGTEQSPFAGHLGGFDHIGQVTTRNVDIGDRIVAAGAGKSVGGLINVLGAGGSISSLNVLGNLTITGTNTGAEMNVGGVVGKADGGVIASVKSEVNVTVPTGAKANVGGLSGYATTATKPNVADKLYTNGTQFQYAMSYSSNTGTVSGGTNAGGIVGLFAGAPGDESNVNTITNTTNGGNVSSSTANANIGGVVGKITGGVLLTIGNGRDTGYATVINPDTGRAEQAAWAYKLAFPGVISGAGSVGGVAGLAEGGAILQNVFNIGSVTGAVSAGGVVGTLAGNAIVADSWFSNETTVTYQADAIVDGAGAVGGIIGRITSAGATVTNNFSLGEIKTGGTSVGGVTGSVSATPKLYKGNYYLQGTATTDAAGAKFSPLAQITFKRAGNVSTPYGKYVFTPANVPELAEDGYYLIKTAEDFIWFSNAVNNNIDIPYDGRYGNGLYGNEICARLANDIDLTDEAYDSIGTANHNSQVPGAGTVVSNRFEGTFDGNGFSITTNVKNWTGGGLIFNVLGAWGVVKNLTVRGSGTSAANTILAGIVGSTYQVTEQNSSDVTDFSLVSISHITNCVNRANITAVNAAAGIGGGGINTDCVNYGNITSTSSSACGIGGVEAIRCKNFGEIKAYRAAGGINSSVATNGSFGLKVRIIECENYGNVTNTMTAPDATFYTDATAGGILGSTGSSNGAAPFEVINCINTGDVTAAVYAGGIIGNIAAGTSYLVATIQGNENYGKITLTYKGNVASIVGGMSAGGIFGATELNSRGNEGYGLLIKDNYNAGAVISESGNGRLSSIGSLKYGQAAGLDGYPTVAINNTTSARNGTESGTIVAEKPKPATPRDPETPNPPIITPNPPTNNSGGSTGTPAPATPRIPVRTIAVAPAAVNAPVVAAVSPPSTADTTLPEPNVTSQPEIIGDLNVPTTVTEDVQSNRVLPIIVIIVIVVVVAVLLLLGAKKRRQGGTES